MHQFPEPSTDEYAHIDLEDTDKPLPETISQSTRYAYFKTIATGGKSLIQSCKDMHLGRVVCYKQLKPEFADDPIEQQRLLREARVSAMLQHPNTVPTYELGRDSKGRVYFTMKLVHGYTLREVLDYRERYDLTQLVDVVIQVAFALEYAHSHGVIHRDIKPENVLVGPYGEVLLLDWGLAKVWAKDPANEQSLVPESKTPNRKTVGGSAKAETGITGQGALQGTLAYMSPEQIARDPDIDFPTDIYSLGAVLYEILAGVQPFTSDNIEELTQQITEQVPPKPSDVARWSIPELLESTAMRALAKDPADRWRSCGELIRLLQQDW